MRGCDMHLTKKFDIYGDSLRTMGTGAFEAHRGIMSLCVNIKMMILGLLSDHGMVIKAMDGEDPGIICIFKTETGSNAELRISWNQHESKLCVSRTVEFSEFVEATFDVSVWKI